MFVLGILVFQRNYRLWFQVDVTVLMLRHIHAQDCSNWEPETTS